MGVRDRGEDDELDVYTELKENIVKKHDGRYEVIIPWIPGAELAGTNEEQGRRRLQNMNMKLRQKEQLQAEYTHIVEEQLEDGIVERIPSKPTGKGVFYLAHKALVRTEVRTEVRMVFDASAKPHPLAASINECMYTGPSLQPLLRDIMIRSRMSENLLLGDIKKAFLQIGIKEEDRDVLRFLFTLHGKEGICDLQGLLFLFFCVFYYFFTILVLELQQLQKERLQPFQRKYKLS